MDESEEKALLAVFYPIADAINDAKAGIHTWPKIASVKVVCQRV